MSILSKILNIHDLAGNILAIYTSQDGIAYELKQLPVYGSSRLGMAEVDDYGDIDSYVYELTDHPRSA